MQRIGINIYEKRIVCQVGYLQKTFGLKCCENLVKFVGLLIQLRPQCI